MNVANVNLGKKMFVMGTYTLPRAHKNNLRAYFLASVEGSGLLLIVCGVPWATAWRGNQISKDFIDQRAR